MLGNMEKNTIFVKLISYFLIFSFVFYVAYTGFNFLLGKNNQKISANPECFTGNSKAK